MFSSSTPHLVKVINDQQRSIKMGVKQRSIANVNISKAITNLNTYVVATFYVKIREC